MKAETAPSSGHDKSTVDLSDIDIFGGIGPGLMKAKTTTESVEDIFGSIDSAAGDIQIDDIFGIHGPTTKKTTEDRVQIDEIFGLGPSSPTLSSEGVQVEDIFGQIPVGQTTKKATATTSDEILILPSTKSPPLDCESDE